MTNLNVVKSLVIFLALVLGYRIDVKSQISISTVPGSYSDQSYTSTDYQNLNTLSDAIKGLKKVDINSSSPYITELSTYWPDGSWNRGYLPPNSAWGDYSSGSPLHNFINGGDPSGPYDGCHPLVRRTSFFGRGHLHAYLINSDSDDKDFYEDAVDYLLSLQESTGAFRVWYDRPGKYTANVDDSYTTGNDEDIYPTAHALRTLCEVYLSGSTYQQTNVYNAIVDAADWLVEEIDWEMYIPYTNPNGQNANNHGLAAWSLSLAYKVVEDCEYINEVRVICDNLVDAQTVSTTDEDGLWKTGKLDTTSKSPVSLAYHDTKIFYHMMTLRGLIEAYEIFPSQDVERRDEVLAAIKRGINHVIEHRLHPDTSGSNAHKLRLWWRSEGGALFAANWIFDGYEGELFDAMILLAYNAHQHDEYSTSERTELVKLVNKTAQYFSPDSVNHQPLISHYDHYMDAISSGTEVFPWDQPLQYDVTEIEGTMVSGDFDNDNHEDDIAAFYYYGSGLTKIHVWTSDGSKFTYQGANGWWQSTSWYDANKIQWRVVSGDFDHDGYKDDIAVFYDYGSTTKIHVFKSNGSSFTYTGASGWWSGGYVASKVSGRVVSGDFDQDGSYDDIAAFYDYGANNTRIHVWKSLGGSFQYGGSLGWWNVGGYDANKISMRVVSGDFDHDNKEDDIAAFYDYGSTTKIHIWRASGSSFLYGGAAGWWSGGYQAPKVTGRVVSGDFDHDNIENDILAFYDYGSGLTRAHVWKSTGGSFQYGGAAGWWEGDYYDANKITGRVVSGDFNNDNPFWWWLPEKIDDVAAFYDMGDDEVNAHVWTSAGTSMTYTGSGGWWWTCYPDLVGRAPAQQGEVDSENIESAEQENASTITVYPNPVHDILWVKGLENTGKYSIKVFNSLGQKMQIEFDAFADGYRLDMSQCPRGAYFIVLESDTGISERVKFLKN